MKKISIAFIFTKYQYNVLLLALSKLNIQEKNVYLIISTKAKNQILLSNKFYKTVFYEQDNESIKNWIGLKDKINKILEPISVFEVENMFLRNYNATISRVIMSKYISSRLYLIEEGIPSYLKESSMLTLPNSFREKIKTLLTRFYFSKKSLKMLPFYKNNLTKVGFSNLMKPWLNVPFLEICLNTEIIEKKEIYDIPEIKYKVVLLDQPLWQVGLTNIEYLELYKKVFNYLQKLEYKLDEILIKPHPSTDVKNLEKLKEYFNGKEINISKNEFNIEELLVANKLNKVEYFVGFFSWSLALIKFNTDKNILGLYDPKLFDLANDSYSLLKDFKIDLKDLN